VIGLESRAVTAKTSPSGQRPNAGRWNRADKCRIRKQPHAPAAALRVQASAFRLRKSAGRLAASAADREFPAHTNRRQSRGRVRRRQGRPAALACSARSGPAGRLSSGRHRAVSQIGGRSLSKFGRLSCSSPPRGSRRGWRRDRRSTVSCGAACEFRGSRASPAGTSNCCCRDRRGSPSCRTCCPS
jgi:hypothetical protein